MLNVLMGIAIVLGMCCVGVAHGAQVFSADVEAALKTEKEIHVATKRKSGEWSKAAPIWFMYDGEALYFTASPTSYKTKRIQRGSAVKVWVGSTDGPSFTGKAEIITDSDIVARMGEAYNQKYWIAWLGVARPRVDRVKSGKTIAVKVTPLAEGAVETAPEK
jgi:PPOX class probable F420-dependent enzyme